MYDEVRKLILRRNPGGKNFLVSTAKQNCFKGIMQKEKRACWNFIGHLLFLRFFKNTYSKHTQSIETVLYKENMMHVFKPVLTVYCIGSCSHLWCLKLIAMVMYICWIAVSILLVSSGFYFSILNSIFVFHFRRNPYFGLGPVYMRAFSGKTHHLSCVSAVWLHE